MASTPIYSMDKKQVGDVDLAAAVFAQKSRLPLVFEAVQAQLTNARQGNASTKTRSDVRGGGKKPWKQKGTGRARAGSSRSPLFVGGGAVFGPHPRDFRVQLPRSARRAALCSVLSLKQRENKVLVVDEWKYAQPKTKLAVAALKVLGVSSGLVVLEAADSNVQRVFRNIPNIKVVPEATLNPYDLLRYDHVVFTKAALTQLTGRLSK